jgi:regulator of protease activity HflC (stomatin/prohibitin superfamily)
MAMKERLAISSSGWLAIVLGLALLVCSIALAATSYVDGKSTVDGLRLATAGVAFLASIVLFRGCFVIGPNEARVLTFFGRYAGTVKNTGLRWANPFASKREMSLRARNFETAQIKVNDVEGNPIEIGAIVVWRVVDTAQALFDVESFQSFVKIQAEAAVRNLAMHHPYDSHDDAHISLRGQSEKVAELLRDELNARIAPAGVEVIDARLSHLAYAPEIAQAMLQRQQAGAIIAARTRIVEGAVSMVEMALDQLAKRSIVELDAERKATMVSNLLIVLCGERAAQPIVNTGTLY